MIALTCPEERQLPPAICLASVSLVSSKSLAVMLLLALSKSPCSIGYPHTPGAGGGGGGGSCIGGGGACVAGSFVVVVVVVTVVLLGSNSCATNGHANGCAGHSGGLLGGGFRFDRFLKQGLANRRSTESFSFFCWFNG